MENLTTNTYICSTCGKTFGLNHNLLRHERKVHSKDRKILICNECNASFPNKSQFSKHWRSTHSTSTYKAKRNYLKICPVCNIEEKHILNHFTTVHGYQINEKSLSFDNVEKFHTWKDEIERTTLSRFVLSSSNKTGEIAVKKYTCNRSGVYYSKSKGIRNLKTQGYRKINGFCPASMVVTISTDNQVHVKVIDCHVGHSHEVRHLNISSVKKEEIARKLMNNVPKRCILNEIRDCRGLNVSREDLITKKDLDNIAAKYNINDEFKKHKNDAINVVSVTHDDPGVMDDSDAEINTPPNPIQIVNQTQPSVGVKDIQDMVDDILKIIANNPSQLVSFHQSLKMLKQNYIQNRPIDAHDGVFAEEQRRLASSHTSSHFITPHIRLF